MPPKTAGRTGGHKKGSEEEKDEVLQAVVIADSFDASLAPFTSERPRCLLPLANTPLLDYTLDFLASCGVQEVYVYAVEHVDQVEAYLHSSPWKSATSPFKKVILIRTAATSVGDMMRDLDQKAIISGDFICVSGDVVSNFPIEAAMKKHKARRETDKNAIMTMVLRESGARRAGSMHALVSTFVIDPRMARCLHYEESLRAQHNGVSIDPDLLDHSELDVRRDLIDCRIDICTPDVLSLWSDNFDNQSPRKDFLHGVLKDHELNGKTIHAYITRDYYAERIRDLSSYRTVSEDIKRGRASPYAVPNNMFRGDAYQKRRMGVFQEGDVMLGRPCVINATSIIGTGTSIGANSHVSNSIIGRRCQIGKDVHIDGAYLWDDTTIGNDVKILKAIIGNEAFVGDRCVISEGALISFGAHIAPGKVIAVGKRVTKAMTGDGESHTSAGVAQDRDDYFHHHYYDEDDDDDDDDDDVDDDDDRAWPGLLFARADDAQSVSSLDSDLSEDAPSSFAGSRSESFTTTTEDGGPDRFHHEAATSLFHRMQEDTNPDDVRVELMGLRFGHNATEEQVRKAVAVATMKQIQDLIESGKQTPAEATNKTLHRYRLLISRTGSQDTRHDQADFLLQAQRDLVHRRDGSKILLFLAKEMYEMEVFGDESEEVILQWWRGEQSSLAADMRTVRASTQQFIEWLENAESEEEDEVEDDDE